MYNIDIQEKREKLLELHDKLHGYKQEKRQLKILCENCTRRESCDQCSNHNQLKLVLGDISYIEGEIGEIEWDVDTWAYTITGNERAEELSYELTDIMMEYATLEEKISLSDEYLNGIWRGLLERGFDEIVEWTINQNSRLAFQVLGEEIIFTGAKMPEDIKELILVHSEWEDEKDQLENEKDRAERKYYLYD